MNYTETFSFLGYSLESIRADWSAEKSDGVCITIRNAQIVPKSYPPRIDLWQLHPDGGEFVNKPGYIKRTRHLSRAVSDFGGKVDVILVDGDLEEPYKDAHPWDCEKRKASWMISKFDPESGYFCAEVVPHEEKPCL